MKIISVFNNKGGVGKSTLTFHVGHTLAELGYKVLLLDLDPQCNLTICAMREETLHTIWEEEDDYIEDFEPAFKRNPDIVNSPRSAHFILKPTEDGLSELADIPPPYRLDSNIDIIPGRLSLHKYENKIAERWSGIYQGDNLAIRTVTNIRRVCQQYATEKGYDFVLIDTSPSLGTLNKVIMSTVDGFFIPAQPDMFSLYGIRNIGSALQLWQKEFTSIYTLISGDKRARFPKNFVQFLGYTIYNSKKYTKKGENGNEYDLAQAHFQYVNRIPKTVLTYIQESNRVHLTPQLASNPIGRKAIIHTHNTYPAMAQALKCPMWKVPEEYVELQRTDSDYLDLLKENGFSYNVGNNGNLREIGEKYKIFTKDLLTRIKALSAK
ncbi:ParA family protein [Chitinophaga varians]|uniref:ParA family protein n=1 Tax=Chitinophaga varians TaxID=2202339 RepID=UPI00165FB618|nr:ParA family protein [Chitinophaga varians]MBC9908956.1 ParA family protein [Chitinophaga varians]